MFCCLFQPHQTADWPLFLLRITFTLKPTVHLLWFWAGVDLRSVLEKPSVFPSAADPWVHLTCLVSATSKRESPSLLSHLCVVCLQLNHFILSLLRTEQTVTLTGLQPNTRYEFAVRLHMDHMSSPWSVTVYQKTSLEGNESARVCDIRWGIRQKFHARVCSAPQLRPLLRWMWKCLWSMTVQRWCRGDRRISPTCPWLITPSCTPHRAHGSLGNGRFGREKVTEAIDMLRCSVLMFSFRSHLGLLCSF